MKMRIFLILICAFAASLGTAPAQNNSRGIVAENIMMSRSGDNVTVAFTLHAGRKSTRTAYSLVVEPYLRNGGYERPLPSIVIRGRHAKILDLRGELAGQSSAAPEGVRAIDAGTSTRYAATIPYEAWMEGGRLVFDGASVGCSSATSVTFGVVAENILLSDPLIEARLVEVPTVITRTTGEQLAAQYPFVASADDFDLLDEVLGNTDDQMILDRIVSESRQGSVSIYFDQGLRKIDANFGRNSVNLVELIAAVRALSQADDSEIAAIVVAGFASPEGSLELNDRLAWDRAVAVKEFLVQNTEVKPEVVKIFNGGADWTGLRELVDRSDIYRKERILDIIDNVPVWNAARNMGRLGELMRLDGGEPYRYMLREFFPQLRQAAYIKVYYK